MSTVTSQLETYRPQRTHGAPSADGEFVVFEHVAVFDSHTGDDGVVYDAALLQHIAQNCNRRLRDTGDFTPVVLAHTRDKEDKSCVTDDPPVLGLAGPFYVGTLGSEKPRACIFATFWIFPECEQTFLRNPRRSVEIWPEERPEDRYFDPISCLGAETPKRDLGLIYSRSGRGQQHVFPGPLRYAKRYRGPLRYEAGAPGPTAPGPGNTFIPAHVRRNAKGEAEGEGSMFTQDDISQLVEALRPLVQAMIDDATSAVGTSEPSTPLEPEMPPASPVTSAAPLPTTPEAPVAPAPEMTHAEPDGDEGGSFDDLDDDDKLYAKGLGRKFAKYAKAEGLDEAGADTFMGALDDDDKQLLAKYMKYACSDDGMKQKYAQRYGQGEVLEEEQMKEGEPARYAKAKAELVIKYRKLQGEHADLVQRYAKQEAELKSLRIKERYAKRESALLELESQGYVLEREEELANTDDYTEEQFDRHLGRIKERYEKASHTFDIPIDRGTNSQEKPQQYAKRAREVVEQYRKRNLDLDYGRVLRHLIENGGELKEDQLLASNGRK